MEVKINSKLETAVVILLFNGKSLLEELLPIALKNTSLDEKTQLILVDNSSTDDTVDWIKQNYPTLPLIEFKENLGFTGGYNKAIDEIDAEFHVLLSSDVEVSENWLPPLINYMKENPKVGASQPKVLSYHKKTHFEYAGAAGGYIDNFGIPFCRGRIFSDSEEDINQYNDIKEVFWASGCCFVVRDEAWKKTKGLDPDFFAHMEEIDLCWRMQRYGYSIIANSESTVYHMGGQTLSYENPFKLYLNCRNNMCMLVKNLPISQLIWKIPTRLLLDWGGAFFFLFTKGFPSFKAVIKGQIDFLKSFSKWYKKRDKFLQTDMKNMDGIYTGSIFFDRYVRGVNKFSNIRK